MALFGMETYEKRLRAEVGDGAASKRVRALDGEVATAPRLVPASSLLEVPVLGVDRSSLVDSFSDPRGGDRRHEAIDIMAPRGTPVVAVEKGTIRKLFVSRAGGLTIYQLDPTGARMYYYAHLDRYAAGLTEGKLVARGDVIGFVGTSGNAPAHAPHLHFGITELPPSREWWKGEAIDPYPLLVR